MIDIVYFSNVTGNTARFVEKLNFLGDKYQIPLKGNFDVNPKNNFIIITPTYGDGDGKGMVPHQVKKFLKNNNAKLIGVIAAGNRNFGKEFGLAADLISYKFKVPVLYKFEIAGLPEDVEKVNKILEDLNKNIGENNNG